MNQISGTISNSKLSTDVWDDFFLNGFINGNAVYSYVLHGKNPSVLSTIKPTGIMNLCDKHNLILGSVLKKYITGNETASANIHFLFALFLNKYKSYGDSFLRALDVLNNLCGDIPLHENLFNLVVDKKLITIEEFSKRYDQCKMNSLNSLRSMKLDYNICNSIPNGQVLERMYHLMNIHRDNITDTFSDYFGLSYQNISIALFIIYMDKKNGIHDTLTDFFTSFADFHWQKSFLNAIKSSGTFSQEDINHINDYFVSSKKDTFNDIIKLLKDNLDVYTDKNDSQPDYIVLDELDETLSLLVPCMYLCIGHDSLQSCKKISFALELLISISPVKILELVKNFIDRNYDSDLERSNSLAKVHENLSLLGIDSHHEMAFKLLSTNAEIFKQDYLSIARTLTLIPEYRTMSLIEKVIRI